MNNEPVAWMMENPQNTSAYLTFEKPTREMKISHQAIPLYTQPAKYCPSEDNAAYEKGFIDGMAKMTESAVHRAVEGIAAKTLTEDTECQYCKQGCIRCDARKLLTNEEIINIAKEHIHQRLEGERFGYVDFARAILRKAQE